MSSNYYPTLADHFAYPEGYRGAFGWVVGFSADADFLNDAATRFSGFTKGQRRHAGLINLAVLLDPGSPQIAPAEVPGVLHLGLKEKGKRPFRLLHAKVAVLGFQSEKDEKDWRVRLIVSTGNWKRETVEQSLDLAWVIEGSSTDGNMDAVIQQKNWLDLHAAWDLIGFLRPLFDTSVDNMPDDAPALRKLDDWMKSRPISTQGIPRFFDNRTSSFLEQVPKLVAHHAGGAARNYLYLGSGFYEGGEEETIPEISAKIIDSMQENRLLTKGAGISFFVEPDSCQRIAFAAEAMRVKGWGIFAPGIPSQFGRQHRTLHAKFIFSASEKSNSPRCLAPWIYLGSGNLTPAGFGKKMSPQSGNLEASVVFMPKDLYWDKVPPEAGGAVVTDVLPIRWDKEVQLHELQPGAPMPKRPAPFLASPVPWLNWKPATDEKISGLLVPPEGEKADVIEVLRLDGTLCDRIGGAFAWPDTEPSQVRVIWDEDKKDAVIPVRNENGQLARGPLPPLDIDEAMSQLLAFPLPPDDDPEDENQTETDTLTSGRNSYSAPAASIAARSPIRKMMRLVEGIASRQTKLREADWDLWLRQLEDILNRMTDDKALADFRALELNPLAPLWHLPFRPDFAETSDSQRGKAYEEVLTRLAQKWGVAGQLGLGEIA